MKCYSKRDVLPFCSSFNGYDGLLAWLGVLPSQRVCVYLCVCLPPKERRNDGGIYLFICCKHITYVKTPLTFRTWYVCHGSMTNDDHDDDDYDEHFHLKAWTDTIVPSSSARAFVCVFVHCFLLNEFFLARLCVFHLFLFLFLLFSYHNSELTLSQIYEDQSPFIHFIFFLSSVFLFF